MTARYMAFLTWYALPESLCCLSTDSFPSMIQALVARLRWETFPYSVSQTDLYTNHETDVTGSSGWVSRR